MLRRDVAMDEIERPTHAVGRFVRVREALESAREHVAGDARVGRRAPLALALPEDAQVTPVDVVEHEEALAIDAAEIVNGGDVRVRELHRDLRLVDEHRDELFVLGEMREDALDGEDALEAVLAGATRLVDLGHTARADALEQS